VVTEYGEQSNGIWYQRTCRWLHLHELLTGSSGKVCVPVSQFPLLQATERRAVQHEMESMIEEDTEEVR